MIAGGQGPCLLWVYQQWRVTTQYIPGFLSFSGHDTGFVMVRNPCKQRDIYMCKICRWGELIASVDRWSDVTAGWMFCSRAMWLNWQGSTWMACRKCMELPTVWCQVVTRTDVSWAISTASHGKGKSLGNDWRRKVMRIMSASPCRLKKERERESLRKSPSRSKTAKGMPGSQVQTHPGSWCQWVYPPVPWVRCQLSFTLTERCQVYPAAVCFQDTGVLLLINSLSQKRKQTSPLDSFRIRRGKKSFTKSHLEFGMDCSMCVILSPLSLLLLVKSLDVCTGPAFTGSLCSDFWTQGAI